MKTLQYYSRHTHIIYGLRVKVRCCFQCRANWVKVDGHHYASAVVVVVAIEEEDPVFGEIKDFFILDSNRNVIHVKLLETVCFVVTIYIMGI